MLVSMLFSVIKSIASTKVVEFRYAFRGWNYVTAIICLFLGKILLYINITSLCCLNTGYGITLVNCTWFLQKFPTEKILKVAILLKVREIKSSKYESNEYVSMSLYFPRIELRNRSIYAHICQKLYLVKDLKANLLVGNNILATERVIIDLANKTTIISSYQVTISITA